jgi:hypothetical protein
MSDSNPSYDSYDFYPSLISLYKHAPFNLFWKEDNKIKFTSIGLDRRGRSSPSADYQHTRIYQKPFVTDSIIPKNSLLYTDGNLQYVKANTDREYLKTIKSDLSDAFIQSLRKCKVDKNYTTLKEPAPSPSLDTKMKIIKLITDSNIDSKEKTEMYNFIIENFK